jgi:hypothetical protein
MHLGIFSPLKAIFAMDQGNGRASRNRKAPERYEGGNGGENIQSRPRTRGVSKAIEARKANSTSSGGGTRPHSSNTARTMGNSSSYHFINVVDMLAECPNIPRATVRRIISNCRLWLASISQRPSNDDYDDSLHQDYEV